MREQVAFWRVNTLSAAQMMNLQRVVYITRVILLAFDCERNKREIRYLYRTAPGRAVNIVVLPSYRVLVRANPGRLERPGARLLRLVLAL